MHLRLIGLPKPLYLLRCLLYPQSEGSLDVLCHATQLCRIQAGRVYKSDFSFRESVRITEADLFLKTGFLHELSTEGQNCDI